MRSFITLHSSINYEETSWQYCISLFISEELRFIYFFTTDQSPRCRPSPWPSNLFIFVLARVREQNELRWPGWSEQTPCWVSMKLEHEDFKLFLLPALYVSITGMNPGTCNGSDLGLDLTFWPLLRRPHPDKGSSISSPDLVDADINVFRNGCGL